MQKLSICVSTVFVIFLSFYFCSPLPKDEEYGVTETAPPDFPFSFDLYGASNLTEPVVTYPIYSNDSYTSPPPIKFYPEFYVEMCAYPRRGKKCLIEARGIAFDEADTICAYNFNKSTGEVFILECKEVDVDSMGDRVVFFKLKFKESGRNRLIFILSVGEFPLAIQNVSVNVE